MGTLALIGLAAATETATLVLESSQPVEVYQLVEGVGGVEVGLDGSFQGQADWVGLPLCIAPCTVTRMPGTYLLHAKPPVGWTLPRVEVDLRPGTTVVELVPARPNQRIAGGLVTAVGGVALIAGGGLLARGEVPLGGSVAGGGALALAGGLVITTRAPRGEWVTVQAPDG